MTDDSDESFDVLLRRAARTPEVTAFRRTILPGSQLFGRFAVEEKLGEGGMGQVFAAFDSELGSKVALKILGVPTPRALLQLKREFRAAAELVHPNLVRLHGLFCDGIEWFFTMDLIKGKNLSRLRSEAGPIPASLLTNLFYQLALALHALHETGTLHGDLKPSNFLITNSDHKVILLDFGLARPLGSPRWASGRAGTREYMAPEQLEGVQLTEATDWYMFGVVLYEALTGSRPTPTPIRDRLGSVPKNLRELCMDLLERQPDARPHGNDVLARIGEQQVQRVISVPPPVPRSGFVGRKNELMSLATAFDRTRTEGPIAMLVYGPSGIGKSALVDQFIREVQTGEATVLAGRCRERESVGYKALDGVVDELQTYLEGLPQPEVEQLLPADIAELTQLFPALRAVPAVTKAIGASSCNLQDQGMVRRHAIGAFRELLSGIRDLGPLVIWIDDLQWSDAESALLLEPLFSSPQPVPLLFVGSYRGTAEKRGPLLDALFDTSLRQRCEIIELAIKPLESEDAEALALQLLPASEPHAKARATSIVREAAGHPLFIAELACSALSYTSTEGVTLGELISLRVAALPEETRKLLEVIAIASAPLPKRVVRRAVSVDVVTAERALHLLCASRLARRESVDADDLIDVNHDRIREVVVQEIDRPTRQQYHLAIARILAAEDGANPEVLAAHLEEGGAHLEASHHWIAAADRAYRTLAFEHAARLYAAGLKHTRLDSVRLRALQIQWAESFACAGNGEAAAEVYLRAAEDSSQDESVELQRRAAEQLLLSGHLDRGLAVIERVLRLLGLRPMRTGRQALPSILLGRARARVRGLRHTHRDETELSRRQLLRIDACWTVACSFGLIDFLRGVDYQTDHLFHTLKAGEPRRLLRALALEIGYAATPGLGSGGRTKAVLKEVEGLQNEIDDPTVRGLVPLTRGIAAYLQGELGESLKLCQQATTLLTKRGVGAIWETITAQRFVVAALFYLGEFRRLSEQIPKLLADGEDRGNLYATSFFRSTYSNTAWLVHDDVAQAREQLRRARSEWKADGFLLPHCWLLVGEAHLAFYTADAAGALACVEEAWPRFRAAGLTRVGVLRVQFWQLSAVSALMAARRFRTAHHWSKASKLLRQARHAATHLQAEGIIWAKPLALLAHAAIDAENQNDESATNRLTLAIATFDSLGMRLYAAAARARLGALIGGSGGHSLIAEAHATFEREGVQKVQCMLDLLAGGFG